MKEGTVDNKHARHIELEIRKRNFSFRILLPNKIYPLAAETRLFVFRKLLRILLFFFQTWKTIGFLEIQHVN